jgi:hypothetical protein
MVAVGLWLCHVREERNFIVVPLYNRFRLDSLAARILLQRKWNAAQRED